MYTHLKKLIYTAEEFGGTVFEVAEDAGLLSALSYLELRFKPENVKYVVDGKGNLPGIRLVLEAYVRFSGFGNKDRIFLYPEEGKGYTDLILYGWFENGCFIIPEEQLQHVAEEKWICVYQSDKWEEQYDRIFGEQKERVPFRFGYSPCYFAGNGWNYALLVQTEYEIAYVMPDIYTVEESIRTIYAEEWIRETYGSVFSLERIDMEDERLIRQAKGLINAAVERLKMHGGQTLPESFRKLYYQIAYLIVYYPKAYETVWGGYVPGEEADNTFLTKKAVSVGIFRDEQTAYGVYYDTYGKLTRIMNPKYSGVTPFSLCYAFDGRDKCDAVAEIVAAAKNETAVKDVYVVDGVTDSLVPFIDVTENGKMQELEMPVHLISPVDAIMQAYNKSEVVWWMHPGDIALLYDFRKNGLFLTLIKKNTDNTYCAIAHSEHTFEESCSYKYDVWEDVKHFVLYEKELKLLGVDEKRDSWSFRNLKRTIMRMRRQLMRSDAAKVVFENLYLRSVENYPAVRFNRCFVFSLMENNLAIEQLLKEAGIRMQDLSGILLAGEECRLPYVAEYLRTCTQKPVCVDAMPELVMAKGALKMKRAGFFE